MDGLINARISLLPFPRRTLSQAFRKGGAAGCLTPGLARAMLLRRAERSRSRVAAGTAGPAPAGSLSSHPLPRSSDSPAAHGSLSPRGRRWLCGL